jgi:hypothetical protein
MERGRPAARRGNKTQATNGRLTLRVEILEAGDFSAAEFDDAVS